MNVAAILTSEESSVIRVSESTCLDQKSLLKVRHTWAVHIYESVGVSRCIRVVSANNDSICTQPLCFPHFVHKLTLPSLNQSDPSFSSFRFIGTSNT